MIQKFKKKINNPQLVEEAKNKGVVIHSITSLKDDVEISTDADVTQIVNEHISDADFFKKKRLARIDKIKDRESVKSFLKEGR